MIFSDADTAIRKGIIRFNTRPAATSSSATKSIATHKSGLTQLSTPEKKFNDADIAIKKKRIKYGIEYHATVASTSAAKSIAPHKFNLSTLTHVENAPLRNSAAPPATPPPTYRAISSPPPIYQATKPYLTVADLYMRYAPLKSIESAHSRPTTTLPTVILPIMSMRDLYKMFHDKEKSVIPTSNRTLDPPANQNAASD
ncbi:MAG: hypothetical protein ASARMPRED_007681, partial [Alectoria sarmentosa]